MNNKGLNDEIHLLAEKKMKGAKESHDSEFSLNTDELSNKTKVDEEDIDHDYFKYILGQDYDEIVQSTYKEFQSRIETSKPSEEGSNSLSTTKTEKFSSDSDTSSFESHIEKLLKQEEILTYKYEQSKSSMSNRDLIKSSSESVESIVSYKSNKIRKSSNLVEQKDLLEERLAKLIEEREEENQSVETEELSKPLQTKESWIKASSEVDEEQSKSSKNSEKPLKVVEALPKTLQVTEELSKPSKFITQRTKPAKLAETRLKSSKIASEQQKSPVDLPKKQVEKLVDPFEFEVKQEIPKTVDNKYKTNNGAIMQKLNNFINSSDSILNQIGNTENESVIPQQLTEKRQTQSSENFATKDATKTGGKVEENALARRIPKRSESRQSSRSVYNRRSSIDSPSHTQSQNSKELKEPIDDSEVEEEFKINEKLLKRMLEENKLMAMKIEQNRLFNDDKSIQHSFIDENSEENVEYSLSEDMPLSKKLSCSNVKPITKRFKRKNLSFSDVEVRKIECENKHLESRIRDLMKKGSKLSVNPSAKYCVEASSSINRRKLDAKTCRENLKIERKIRDIKTKSNQKAPWAVPVWI